MRDSVLAVIVLSLLVIAAAVLSGCSEDEPPHADRQEHKRPVSALELVDADASRSDCIDYMALEYIEALTTNDCRTILDWEWCPVMAVAMELRVENGQTIGRLAALWERDCS